MTGDVTRLVVIGPGLRIDDNSRFIFLVDLDRVHNESLVIIGSRSVID